MFVHHFSHCGKHPCLLSRFSYGIQRAAALIHCAGRRLRNREIWLLNCECKYAGYNRQATVSSPATVTPWVLPEQPSSSPSMPLPGTISGQTGQNVPYMLCSIFHRCTRVVKFDKRYYSHASSASSKFVKEVVNKTRSENEMKIKLAVAAIVILGGLASLAYAQRSSAICPMHGVSGSPTGAPINDKGQCEYQHSMDKGDSIHRFRASCYY